jgi:hypothetical protein
MAANAELSQLVGCVCKGCLHNNHTWEKSRVIIFDCINPKSCAPSSPEDLSAKAGSIKRCPLKRTS